MPQPALSEFADKINQVMPALMKNLARREVDELYKGKITIQQFLILESLYKDGASKMSSLAGFMGVSTAAITGIVDRLVREGYAQRVYDPKDRRIINIELTAKGGYLVKNIIEKKRQMIIRMFSKVSEADRRDYLRVITRIKDNLTQEG